MKRGKAFFFVVASFLILLMPGLHAPSRAEVDIDRLESALGRLEQRYKTIRTIQGNFLQVTKRVSQGKRDFRENGRFFFYLPGKMRWEYDSDPKKVIVSDGATLWMLEPAESGTQVLKTSLSEDTLYKTPLALLLGAGSLRNSFEVVSLDEGPNELKLGLTPKRATDMPLKKLTLYLSSSGDTIQGIVMLDYFGNQTALRFSNLKWNKKLSAGLFRFRPPKGAEVIER